MRIRSDESGEDYIYPARWFMLLDLPQPNRLGINQDICGMVAASLTKPCLIFLQFLFLSSPCSQTGNQRADGGLAAVWPRMLEIVRQCARLHVAGVEVVVVSPRPRSYWP